MDLALPWWRRRPAAEATGDEAQPTTAQGELSEDHPVVIAVFQTQLEAGMAHEALRSAGIPAMVQGGTVGALYGLSLGPLAQVSLLVPASREPEALAVLESIGLLPEES